jgi:hypothetical protein
MDAPTLASICHWGNTKPAAHVALVKTGFVERMKPRGFKVHEWDEHNRQLLQKWTAGEKGGRPPASEKVNVHADSQKPDANRPLTDREPGRNPIDPIRSDPIDQRREDRSDPTVQTGSAPQAATTGDQAAGTGMDSKVQDVGGGTDRTDGRGLDAFNKSISTLATSKRPVLFTPPTLAQVEHLLMLKWKGAEEFAEPFWETMTDSGWHDRNGQPIKDWHKAAVAYAKSCWENRAKERAA